MNKTFMKVLASLLAVLMVLSAIPFTASAAQNNRKWWEDDSIDPTTITEEPFYYGYNTDEEGTEHQPIGPWEHGFGEAVDIDDGDHEDHRDDYKPILAVTVSDQGQGDVGEMPAAQAKEIYGKYYGATTARDYETVKDEGYILNPTELKAGQRIALTIEIGGIDTMFAAQLKGSYDKEYLKAAYYTGSPSRSDTWKDATDSSAWIVLGTEYYAKAFSCAGQNVDPEYGTYYVGVTSAKALGGSYDSNFIGTGADDKWGARPFGKYGVLIGVLSFYVIKDCDLSEVFHFDGGTAGTQFIPFSPDKETIKADKMDLITMTETARSMSLFATVWSEATASEEPEPEPEHQHSYTSVEVDPTCTEDGKTVYTCESEDGLACDAPSYEEVHQGTALGHLYEGAVTPNVGEKTHEVQCVRYAQCGSTETKDCTPTGDGTVSKEPTCAEEGYEAGTVCSECAQVLEAGKTLDKTEDHKGQIVPDTDKNKAATCTDGGWENATKCDLCGETVAEGNATDPIPHDFTGDIDTSKNDAEGHYRKCAYDCGTVSETPEQHNMQEVPDSAVAPEVGKAGKEADQKCDDCGYTVEGQEIPALEEPAEPTVKYNVTVVSKPLGKTEITYFKDGVKETATVEAAAVGTQNVTVAADHDSTIVVKAIPNDGVEFVGWMVNSSILNADVPAEEDIEHSATVLAPITYEPIFQYVNDTDPTFTVVFTDKFGNVFSTWTGSDASQIVIPAAPTYVGYTFAGWSLSEEEIKALTGPATIMATYTKDEAATYTVTAAGATITAGDAQGEDTLAGIAFDTLVTVTAPDATAWKIDGATVAYGNSYSFYVGANVTLTYETEAVTAKPVVAAVSTDSTGTTGAIKASFLATRSMVEGYTYVNAGFIYSTKTELTDKTLADVDQSTIKAYYCTTSVEQFALIVGRSGQSGDIYARAFLAFVDQSGSGETEVVYADFDAFTYGA